MSSHDGYLPDVGDAVRVKAVTGFGGYRDGKLVGKTGTITHNDGWGLCRVEFGDGTFAYLWNAADLEPLQTNP